MNTLLQSIYEFCYSLTRLVYYGGPNMQLHVMLLWVFVFVVVIVICAYVDFLGSALSLRLTFSWID